MNHKLSQNVFVYILIFQFIHRNRTTHFYRNYFSRILSVPIRRTPKRNSGSPKQIREKMKRPITTVCLGLPFEGPPFGATQNPRENNFYKNGLSCYGVYILNHSFLYGSSFSIKPNFNMVKTLEF